MKKLVGKLLKSELWVVLIGMLAALLAPKLGIPEEQLTEVLTSIAAIASSYVLGRSYAKPRELATKNPS